MYTIPLSKLPESNLYFVLNKSLIMLLHKLFHFILFDIKQKLIYTFYLSMDTTFAIPFSYLLY